MAQEDVAAVQRVLDAFSSGDMDRILALIASDFVATIPPALSAEPDTYRGHDGVRRYFQTFTEAMSDIRFEGERFWDAGDAVVAAVRMTARGRQTAIMVEQLIGQVWRMRDGRAASVQSYPSMPAALRAAGLPELC